MLQSPWFVPENGCCFLVCGSELVVTKFHDTGVRSESSQMYVYGDL
ncbi:hypothetical protein GTY41_24325 [Streptomyces sp. SID685]|nr:hypothetical protein [Streptomyces sp. SID685]MYR87965.1 hypothetical protein [Streptomyces sp. SID685]